jgi:hypothetical protein
MAWSIQSQHEGGRDGWQGRAFNVLLLLAAQHEAMPADEAYIIEFLRVGAYVKVSAVDPASLTEVSIVGDPAAGEELLTRTAVRKLERVLDRPRGRNF